MDHRSRAYAKGLPQSLAALTNDAVSMVPCQTSFGYLPVTNRDVAARNDEALSLLMAGRGNLSARSDTCAQRV